MCSGITPIQHPWVLSTAEARELQQCLKSHVKSQPLRTAPRWIAGADVSGQHPDKTITAVVVLLSYPGWTVHTIETFRGNPTFPYMPGLLSFRETPLLLKAFAKLSQKPDLIFVDGHGIAHPRRFGLACHLGLWLNIPTIGCAKSLLVGEHEPLGQSPGDSQDVYDHGEKIAIALRSRQGSKPIYLSPGHLIDFNGVVLWSLRALRCHRLPEPIRIADAAARKAKHQN